MKKNIKTDLLFAIVLISSGCVPAGSDHDSSPSQIVKDVQAIVQTPRAMKATHHRMKASPISMGYDYDCALVGKKVTCWGNNEYGQINVPELKNPIQVTVGFHHSCALDETGIKCWGRNDFGQAEVPQLNGVVQISAGGNNTCALAVGGVKCWGDSSEEVTKVPALKNPFYINVGITRACALDDDGVKCWGTGPYGDDPHNVLKPPSVHKPTELSVGSKHACVIDADGVKCWGENDRGQTEVPPLKNPKKVLAQSLSTCAFDDDGMKCWGESTYQKFCKLDSGGVSCWQVVKDNGVFVTSYYEIPDSLKSQKPGVPPIHVSVGYSHQCVLDIKSVRCWGDNKYGQINIPSLKAPKIVAAGGNHTCVLDAERVRCWGDNKYGQIIVPPLKKPYYLAAGGEHTCAIDLEGLKCWGDFTPRETFSYDFKAVSVGYNTACFIIDKWGVRCAEAKAYGAERYFVGKHLKNVEQVSVGFANACAIVNDALVCHFPVDTSKVVKPRQISVGVDHSYVIDSQGLKTWSKESAQMQSVPSQVGYLFHVSTSPTNSDEACWVGTGGVACKNSKSVPRSLKLYIDLSDLQPAFTPVRALWAEELTHLKSDLDLSSIEQIQKLWFKMALSSHVVRSADSLAFIDTLGLQFEKSFEVLRSMSGFLNIEMGLENVPDDQETRKMALASIHGVLKVISVVQSVADQQSTQDAIRLLGISKIDPMNDQKMQNLVRHLAQMKKEKGLLSQSNKTSFLVPTLELAVDWLQLVSSDR